MRICMKVKVVWTNLLFYKGYRGKLVKKLQKAFDVGYLFEKATLDYHFKKKFKFAVSKIWYST